MRNGNARRIDKAVGLTLAAIAALWVLVPALAHGAMGGFDENFRVRATTQDAPPAITLSWDFSFPDSGVLYRRTMCANTGTKFSQVSRIPSGATSITDASAAVGVAYEYKVSMTPNKQAVIASGIKIPHVEYRGKIVLIVDQTVATPCARELSLLQQDLVGDGWQVIRHDVARDDGNFSTRHQAKSVKSLIVDDYKADPANVKAVLLLGRVPVPYSGWMNPDGHYSRAIACDGYYGDIDGVYTDASVNRTSTDGTRGSNLPGDGKFDQSSFPTKLELMVGRVDLAGLTKFSESEAALLKRYVAKDHAWRHRGFTVQSNSLINWTRGWHWGAYDTAYALTDNVYTFGNNTGHLWAYNEGSPGGADGDFQRLLSRQANLFAHIGSAMGSNESAGGISVDHIRSLNALAIFMFEGASYSVDWSYDNNFQRSFVAASGYSLCGGFSEFPTWYLHHLGAGAPLGMCSLAVQNNDSSYYDAFNGNPTAFISLMGDPTVRMCNVAPPTQLTAASSGGVVLSWTASAEAGIAGYHVYHAASIDGKFSRLNASLVTGTTYTDSTARSTDVVYMVRAVKLQTTLTATFWDISQGAFVPFRRNATTNRLPTANAQTISGGQTITITLTGSDPDGDPLTYVVNEYPKNGKLAGEAPNLTYTAYDGNGGTDRLTFTVHDAWGASAPATVTLNMAPAILVRGPNMSDGAISIPFLPVWERSTATFQIKLSAPPAGNTTVAVARSLGVADLSVASGASLPFTTSNWDVWQTVTLAAADNSVGANAFATIACSASGLVGATVRAVELDNDIEVTIVARAGGTVSPTGMQVMSFGEALAISATPSTGYVFSHWTIANTDEASGIYARARLGNAWAASTTVTPTCGCSSVGKGVTVTANFLSAANAIQLTVTAGAGGTVYPSGVIWVGTRETVPVSAFPSAGSRFVNWTMVRGPGTFDYPNRATANLTNTTSAITVRADFGGGSPPAHDPPLR